MNDQNVSALPNPISKDSSSPLEYQPPTESPAPAASFGFQPLEPIQKPTPSNKKYILGMAGLAAIVLVITAAWLFFRNQPIQNSVPNTVAETITTVPIAPAPTPTVQILPALTPSPAAYVASSSATAAAASTIAQVPADWATFNYPKAGLVLYAPSNWNGDVQQTASNSSELIRLWPGSNSVSPVIQLKIQQNWDNTGDAQNQPKNFQVNSTISAYKIDPPQLSEQKQASYTTSYYFENNSHVYIFQCTHNWVMDQYQLCENILKNIQFK